MGMLIDRQRHSALRQLFTGGSVTFMGDPTALAVAAVASQRLRHLRVAQPGIVDAHHVAVAAQGLFQQAVDPLPVVLPRQHLAELQMRKALGYHLTESLNTQTMGAEVLASAEHQHFSRPMRH